MSEPIRLLAGKRIVLGVTGSIAVYKAADLASKLTQTGARVDVVMTESAQRFVTPLTFQAVTGRPVYTDLWQGGSAGLPTHIAHVGLGEGADVLFIAPCSANTLAKLAQGLADDLLSVTALAARCPLILAPAMDGSMYEHPATQANVQTLLQRGAAVIEPVWGRFASGLEGRGRLPEVPALIGHLRHLLGMRWGALAGRRIVVTAGGTREAIDPVRYVGNHSSGKQGYAIAQAALDAGAQVTLISSAHLLAPVGVRFIQVESAADVLEAVLASIPQADALIMAAAVADFRPQQAADRKIKKSDDESLTLTLGRTADVLLRVAEVRAASGWPRVVVGFAAESHDLLANAQAKLSTKRLDLLVANDVSAPDAGFAVDTNRVVLLRPAQAPEALPLLSKQAVAERIVDEVARLIRAADDA
ncbi:MAG: bifunctional phosphopantothenoylcysteine decarboxylase/phosphopantothenate--cysteine ligase CoaBC [Anaerolineae bacterium]|nr:bifunctional phosphopantothenoylcysteine decarboxylase/phosphopantothenate--cysteine ligase CoaBC [Anaerolineae bacterium]